MTVENTGYTWLWLCLALLIGFSELYYPHKVRLYGAFFLGALAAFTVSLITVDRALVGGLFLVLSPLFYILGGLLRKNKRPAFRSRPLGWIVLHDIPPGARGEVYRHGKITWIRSREEETLRKGTVVYILPSRGKDYEKRKDVTLRETGTDPLPPSRLSRFFRRRLRQDRKAGTVGGMDGHLL